MATDVQHDSLAWPFYDDAHRVERDALERWAADALPGLVSERDDDPAAVDACVTRLVRALGAAGMLRACVPAAYGGYRAKLEVRSLCVARETLARASGLADFALAMQGLGSAPISLFGSDAQREAILPAIARGERIGAFALSEPDAGSDAAAISTTATREGDGWRLDGVKTWISNAGIATQYVVFARTDPDAGTKGVSAFIVEATSPGIEVEPIRVIAPHPLGTVRFSSCRVPADALLGSEGQGFRIAMGTLDVFRSTVGAAALGFARRALDEATRRARERTMFGRTLADMQLTQAKLGEMALSIDAAALLIARSGWTRDVGNRRITREASMAKLYATEIAQQVIDAAVQVFGGLGVVHGITVERLYREIRALRIYEGASEVLKLVIGGDVLAAARTADASAGRPEA